MVNIVNLVDRLFNYASQATIREAWCSALLAKCKMARETKRSSLSLCAGGTIPSALPRDTWKQSL